MVPDGRASHNRADRTAGRTREQSASLLHAILTATLLAGRLVEPGANVTLPPLVEMRIRNHIVALTHLDGFLFWSAVGMEARRNQGTENRDRENGICEVR